MAKIGIYRITNLLNNKSYIGSSINLTRRKAEHFYRFRSKRGNSILKNSIIKHGIENFAFDIVEELYFGDWAENDYIKDILEAREQFYLDTINPEYNIRQIATSNLGWKIAEDFREHLRNLGRSGKGRKISFKTIEEYDLEGNFIREWRCAREASIELNICNGALSRVLSGEYKQTKGKIFKYK